jgi:hypothetical protein
MQERRKTMSPKFKADLAALAREPFVKIEGVMMARLIELVSVSGNVIDQVKTGNEVDLTLAILRLANVLTKLQDTLDIVQAGPAVGDA